MVPAMALDKKLSGLKLALRSFAQDRINLDNALEVLHSIKKSQKDVKGKEV